jgi:diacylglycerol kinase family enzyme
MTDSIDGAASRKCAMLIINPISGTGNKKNVPEMVAGRLKEFGFDLDVRFTG